MIDSFLKWAGTIDWNSYAELAIEYAYILYYLPFPLIAMGAYFLFKSIRVPLWILRLLLAVLVTVCFYYFHQKHITVPQGELDFELIEFVAKEYLAGASMALLAIIISAMKGIISMIKKGVGKEKQIKVA